jgi:tripeptide aminopeptidase
MTDLVRGLADDVVAAAPGATVDVAVRQQYPNMLKHLKAFPEVVETATRAYAAEGIEPIREPIRGGTDGSRLSAMGLPTPNLFAGGHDFHSPREWVSVQDMAAAAAVVVRLAAEWAGVA